MEYGHLTLEERTVIMICMREGRGIAGAARWLGRAASTIRRELARNPHPYEAVAAQVRAADVSRWRRRRKLDDAGLRAEVDRRLRQDHSPRQIAHRLRLESGWQISHGTVYGFIREQLRAGVKYGPHLRRGDPRGRRPPRGQSPHQRIREGRSIEERPVAARERREVGHIESDTLKGLFHSPCGLATHVDRKTRYLILARLPDRKAATYVLATQRAFARHGLSAKTFTVDNGMEFSQHRQMEAALGGQVFFAHRYSPWERGLNENTNGLLRQYFPKGCNLARVTEEDLQRVECLLNNRPRECLGYRTPAEALQQELRALDV